MTKKAKSITGAIFCGGQSKRMGRPKSGIILPSGMTIIEVVYNALKPLCERICLVGHTAGVPESLNHLTRVEDNFQEFGPIAGLEAVLSSDLADEYIISPCDLFKVETRLFELLINAPDKPPVVLGHKSQMEPLIGRYDASILATVRARINDRQFSMHQLLESCQASVVQIPEAYTVYLSNANSPEDLANN